MKTIRIASALYLSLFLVACQQGEDEEIKSAIEELNGGLDMNDEPAAFGDLAPFDELDAYDLERTSDDPMDADPDVAAMRERPDAAHYAVTVVWGQIPGDPDNTVAHDWSGRISVSRGAVLVRAVLRFEERTDEVLPREDRTFVAFTSVTLPHHDGLRLAIIDPEPRSDAPIVLTYEGRDGTTLRVNLDELAEEAVELEVDDAGNRIVAVASRRGLDVCDHGFLGGVWQKVTERAGRLHGRVVSAEGAPLGHLRGIFGVKENGEHVFFGKYIDLEGRFRGIFGGHYRDGRFEGRWLSRSGEVGRLGGHYRDARVSSRPGRFIGRWAQTSCDL